jgi:transposase-like protein
MYSRFKPRCPECKRDNVYPVTTEWDGMQRWHCLTCKNRWPVTQADKQLNAA